MEIEGTETGHNKEDYIGLEKVRAKSKGNSPLVLILQKPVSLSSLEGEELICKVFGSVAHTA